MKRRQLHVPGSILRVPHAWALTIGPNPFRPMNHAYPTHHPNSAPGGHLASVGLDRRTQDANVPWKGRSFKYHSFYKLLLASLSTD
jgi:hypothetical protein